MGQPDVQSVSEALERLALALGEAGAVPVAELIRALERAAERLRTHSVDAEPPDDLVTQAEASRRVGVSRQAVNQWVRNGTVSSYVRDSRANRQASEVSLSEILVAANRRSREVPYSSGRRRELFEFLALLEQGPAAEIATGLRESIEDEDHVSSSDDRTRVLLEFVVSSMGIGPTQHEFDEAGLKLLADLEPRFPIDAQGDFGRLAGSLDLLVRSSGGTAGFDSPVAAVLGLLGTATVGPLYPGTDADAGRAVARAAEQVWGPDWLHRLYDTAFHVGQLRPAQLSRYTAALTYLDTNRFLRQAQSSGVSIAYARGPGLVLPGRIHGAPVLKDVADGTFDPAVPWRFSSAASGLGRPADLSSGESPFRPFHYEYGLLDPSIHGIRRYSYSEADVRRQLSEAVAPMSPDAREWYLAHATETLTRTLTLPHIELSAVGEQENFDWWKDHLIRSSDREVLIGLRDERARRTAHALVVETSILPEVVESAASDGSMRDRLRIYVKNLEFGVIDARYRDDLRRGVVRMIKEGGVALSEREAREAAGTEIRRLLA